MREEILIVEDDTSLAELITLHLNDQGYATEHVADAQRGLERAPAGSHQFVILDVMLPRLDGLEVCKRLRADDYVTKPFGIRGLVARVKALLRRANPEEEDTPDRENIICANLEIDLDKRKVTLGDERLDLTSKEFELLALFASRRGRVYSREQLLEQVWGYHSERYRHPFNSHINRLRAKIERDPAKPCFIQTVWGVGYRFAEA